jgi:uncharacterized protein (TIGR03435 family)
MNRMRALALTMTIATSSVSAQTPATSIKTFDVVSIKPNTSAGNMVMIRPEPNGKLLATNVAVRMLLRLAFRPMQDYQIFGGPSWLTTDRFDIQAQPESPLSQDEMSAALRLMLEDRFQMKTHRETREMPIYNLVVAKEGKLKSVDAPPPFNPGQAPPPPPPPPAPGAREGLPANFTPPPGAAIQGPGGILASAMPMSQFVNFLSARLGRPVIDKTNLKGYFDIRLEFAPESAPGNVFGPGGPPPGGPVPPATAAGGASDPQGPAIFTAIQEQLGLKLESSKGVVDVVVIDSIQKPTEN